MAKLRCMFRIVFWGGEDDSALIEASAEAKRRHDHAIRDLNETMEAFTSGPGNGK